MGQLERGHIKHVDRYGQQPVNCLSSKRLLLCGQRKFWHWHLRESIHTEADSAHAVWISHPVGIRAKSARTVCFPRAVGISRARTDSASIVRTEHTERCSQLPTTRAV